MSIWNNWRFLVVFCIVVFGVWGFLAKLCSQHLHWAQLTFWIMATNAAIVLTVTAPSVGAAPNMPWAAVAALSGAFASMGSLTMYRTLSLAPASKVIPITSLYIVVTVLLSVLFLHEPLTVRKVAGIVLGLIAMILLADPSGA